MHDIKCFAIQNVPLTMDGQGLPKDGCGDVLAFPVGIGAFFLLLLSLAPWKFGVPDNACEFPAYPCAIHVNSQGIHAILFVEAAQSMWIPRVSAQSFLSWPGHMIRVNSWGMRAFYCLVGVARSIWIPRVSVQSSCRGCRIDGNYVGRQASVLPT